MEVDGNFHGSRLKSPIVWKDRVEWVRAVCARLGGNVLLLLWKY